MNKDLTQSLVDRQNVLNNPFALNEAKKYSILANYILLTNKLQIFMRLILGQLKELLKNITKN